MLKAVNVLRSHTQSINVRSRTVHSKLVRTDREYGAATVFNCVFIVWVLLPHAITYPGDHDLGEFANDLQLLVFALLCVILLVVEAQDFLDRVALLDVVVGVV